MSGDLELTILHVGRADSGLVTGVAVTDQMVVTIGLGVQASADGRRFERRVAPGELGLRDVLAVGDAVWVCGDHGLLAVSRDHARTWTHVSTATRATLRGLALGADGAIWCVGDDGTALRLLGEAPARVDFQTRTRLGAVYAVRDDIVALGDDGKLRRWADGKVTEIATGSTRTLTALAVTKSAWIVTGVGGFIGRSPDGTWFSRVKTESEADLEGIAALRDGRVVVVGDHGQILVSSDEGRTWSGVPHALGDVHLWSIERFGGGVLVGGAGGLVARVAPAGDATWADRAGEPAARLDALFADGPAGFIERKLGPYLVAIEVDAEEDEDDHLDDDDEDSDDDDDDSDDDEDDGDEDEGDEDGELRTRGATPDDDAFDLLAARGDETDFADIYGVFMPSEAVAFFAKTADADRARSFAQWRLDRDVRPDVGDKNLFELMVRRNQSAELGTDLAEAFCGVFGIGTQGNGDSYHMEIYEWDGPRQVIHFDHETASFSGVIADSLDSFVYLTALTKAGDDGAITPQTYELGVRSLRGHVAPTWPFAIEKRDPTFVHLEAKRRETEFFFYRSRWICALLENGTSAIADVPDMFTADLNQPVPVEQLPARYEACEKFIPTALYAMWRAYLFDEPELGRYLEIGRAHAARLVHDAARLIDELRDGRNQLGTITDVRAWLAAFRALELDPRGERRAADVTAELARAQRSTWADLAWKWIDDRIAHRTLLGKLTEEGDVAQIAALDELGGLDDAERARAVERVAVQLSPELEAILAGSVVRGDVLTEVVRKAATTEPVARGDGPGWSAIDAALAKHYGAVKQRQWGAIDAPLPMICAYTRLDPVPHWHFVTYGFTDLDDKETDDEDSGYGFELTLRVARRADDAEPPAWALDFLQNLARYVFHSGNTFAAGHKMGLNGPIALDRSTKIAAVCFADDPELGDIESPYGAARFVQIVGITDDEYRLIQEWTTTGLLDILKKKLPMLVTDLGRDSVLADAELSHEVERRVSAEGSSEDLSFAGEMKLDVDDGRVRIELGALYAAALPRAMRGRLRHGRPYELRGRDHVLALEPSSSVGYSLDDDRLALLVTQELARELEVQLRDGEAGTYDFEAWPALEIVVTPSFITARDGRVIDVKGIANVQRAKQMIDAENARRAVGAGEEDDDFDDLDEIEDDEADVALRPERVLAALRLSERAIGLAPTDPDVQFTHAMLLMDGEVAGLPGKLDELLALLPELDPATRLNAAVRLVEVLLERAPDRVGAFVPMLPDDVDLLSTLAIKAIQSQQPDAAMALYDRVLAEPVPTDGPERENYLRALNNACIQAHGAKAFAAAVKIADRAQPVAHENPYIFHSAACAYAAVGDYTRALQQVKLAMQHEYAHVLKVEVDSDLGPLLEWPEFKALFRDWHARQEGN